MKYETLEKAILAILAVYFVIGAGWKFLPGGHLYPFFSWDLYSTIPNSFSVYDIRFTEVAGKKYVSPTSYKEIFPKEKSDELFLLAEDLSIPVKSGNQERIAASQADLEAMVGPGKISYDLVESIYNPLDYKNGKPPRAVNNIGHFELP